MSKLQRDRQVKVVAVFIVKKHPSYKIRKNKGQIRLENQLVNNET